MHLCVLLFTIIFAQLHVSKVERFWRSGYLLQIQNLSTTPKIATKKLIIERHGGGSSRKIEEKEEESQNKKQMEKGV